MSTVVSLCDLTGNMVQPWVEAGYDAVLVDPQHLHTRRDGPIYKVAGTLEDSMDILRNCIQNCDVAAVFGFPPCTDMAVSGARWFEAKRQADPMFQAKAVAVAEQCRTIGRLSGAPWFVENPVSVLRRVFGKPDHYFDPCDYTAFEPADNYTKKTCLWTGGGFVMPAPQRDLTLGPARWPDPQSALRKFSRSGPGEPCSRQTPERRWRHEDRRAVHPRWTPHGQARPHPGRCRGPRPTQGRHSEAVAGARHRVARLRQGLGHFPRDAGRTGRRPPQVRARRLPRGNPVKPPYAIAVAADGEDVRVVVYCSPLTGDHLVSIPTEELQEAVAVARSRQLGVDARGDL